MSKLLREEKGLVLLVAGFVAFILIDYFQDQVIKGYFIYDVAVGYVGAGGT